MFWFSCPAQSLTFCLRQNTCSRKTKTSSDCNNLRTEHVLDRMGSSVAGMRQGHDRFSAFVVDRWPVAKSQTKNQTFQFVQLSTTCDTSHGMESEYIICCTTDEYIFLIWDFAIFKLCIRGSSWETFIVVAIQKSKVWKKQENKNNEKLEYMIS